MKPKTGSADNPGFLEYLEDIIGTCVLIEPIETLENEIETLKNALIEKSEDFWNVETEVRSLNESKNEAVEFLKQEK